MYSVPPSYLPNRVHADRVGDLDVLKPRVQGEVLVVHVITVRVVHFPTAAKDICHLGEDVIVDDPCVDGE